MSAKKQVAKKPAAKKQSASKAAAASATPAFTIITSGDGDLLVHNVYRDGHCVERIVVTEERYHEIDGAEAAHRQYLSTK